MIGIYKITSPSNKIYIGQSTNIRARLLSYKNIERSKNQVKLYRSFKKYGFCQHDICILELCDISLLNERERFWQDFYNSIKTGLNCLATTTLTKSGFACQKTKDKNLGKKASLATKIKMSESQKKAWTTDRKLAMSAHFSKRDAFWKKGPQSLEYLEKRMSKIRKPILQYDLENNFIKEWKSAKEVEQVLGYGSDYISLVARNKKEKYKNYKWQYKNVVL